MRATIAILFSLLLACAQSVSSVNGLTASPLKSAGCACHQMSCCVESAPASQSAPALPAPSVSQGQLALWLPAAVRLLELPEVSRPGFPAHVTPAFGVAAIPLYERNCSYLI